MTSQPPPTRSASNVTPARPSYREQSQATAVFVLGLLGMFVFPLLAPFAWTMGNRELAAIKVGRRDPANQRLARIGQILGIVMSSLMLLFAGLVFGLLLISF